MNASNCSCPGHQAESGSVPQRLMGAFIRLNRQHWKMHIAEGLRPHEFSILHAVRRFSCENGAGPRASDLSGRLNVAPPTITQQINELERRGLVERRRDGDDRRAVRIALSAEGESLLERNRESVLSFFSEIADRLGPERSETLAALLTEVSDYLEPQK